MRLLWCKINKFPLAELEPNLVTHQAEQIDIDRGTLRGEYVPLVLTGLTLKNYRSYEEFYVCRQCGKVYWQGTHWQRRVSRNSIVKPKPDEESKNHDDAESDDGIIFYDAENTL